MAQNTYPEQIAGKVLNSKKIIRGLSYRLAEANKRIIKAFKRKGTKKHKIEEDDHISMI